MKTKMNIKSLYIVLCGLVLSFASCRDYMTEIEPGTIPLEDFFVSTDAAVQNVTGCIHLLCGSIIVPIAQSGLLAM